MRGTAMIVAAIAGCGVRQLPAMTPPARVMPQLPDEVPLPEPDTTPVAIDADVPSRVYDEFERDICLTPCVVNMARGVRDLRFEPIDRFSERRGRPSLTVGWRPLAYRYALGRHEHHDGLRAGGLAALVVGSIAAVAALPMSFMPETRTVGQDVAIGSGIAVVAGIVMMVAGRDVVQMGTGTAWAMSPITTR